MGSFVENVNKIASLTPANVEDLSLIVQNIDAINAVAPLADDLNDIVNNIVPNLAEILLADNNATIATEQALLATTNGAAQVSLATAQVGLAVIAKNSSEDAKDIATTQAGIATTKAGEASTSASNASNSEVSALTYKNLAQGYADSINPSLLVHTTGDETISNTKTFTSFPITPSSAPLLDYQMANKKYVDDNMSSIGHIIQVANFTTGAVAIGTAVIPADNTIPQITEGTQFMSLAFTPKKANSKLKITVVAHSSSSVASNNAVLGLFIDGVNDALASSMYVYSPAATALSVDTITSFYTVSNTNTRTFTVRIGGQNTGTITFNGSAGAPYMGGTLASSITIEEIAQ